MTTSKRAKKKRAKRQPRLTLEQELERAIVALKSNTFLQLAPATKVRMIRSMRARLGHLRKKL